MPDDNLRETAIDMAQGTCRSVEDIAESLSLLLDRNVTSEEVEEALADSDIELCSSCGWWCETNEMTERDDEPICCDCAS